MAAGCNNNKIEQVRTISVITRLEENDAGIPREEPLSTNDLFNVMQPPVGEAYVKLFAEEITLDEAIAMIEEKAKNTLDKMKLEKATTQDVQR